MLATKTKSKLDIKSNWDKNLNTPKGYLNHFNTLLATGEGQNTCPPTDCPGCVIKPSLDC